MNTKTVLILTIVFVVGLILFLTRKKIMNVVTGIPSFLSKFLPYANIAAKKFGFSDPYFLLSQMYAENSGKSHLLDVANNVGSLISRVGAKKLATNEFWKGDEVGPSPVGLWFRKYATLQDGFNDYARTLSRYYSLQTATSIHDYASKVSNSKYIDEKNGDNRAQYAANILGTYDKLKQATA